MTKLTKSMEMVKMVKMVMQKLSKLYEYGTSTIYARTGRSKQSGRQEENIRSVLARRASLRMSKGLC